MDIIYVFFATIMLKKIWKKHHHYLKYIRVWWQSLLHDFYKQIRVNYEEYWSKAKPEYEEISKSPKQGRNKHLVKFVNKRKQNVWFYTSLLAPMCILLRHDEACTTMWYWFLRNWLRFLSWQTFLYLKNLLATFQWFQIRDRKW